MLKFKTASFVLFVFILCHFSYSQTIQRMKYDRFSHYDADDWITYAPATFISSIDVGEDYIYFGTRNGGVLRYNVYDKFWDYPLTTSNGLRSNYIYKVIFSRDDFNLYVKHNKGVDAVNLHFGYARPADGMQIPAQRKPSADDVSYYLQNKNFNFPEYFRPGNDLLPDFFSGRDIVYHGPDNIVDPYNRTFRLNPDRVVDHYRTLWLSTNGLGVAAANIDNWTFRTEQHSISNIAVRDILLEENGVWIGGHSLGQEPDGVTYWNDQDDIWTYYEARYNMDMYSDNVNAICSNSNYVFFATELGLLRFNKKKKEWQTPHSAQRLQHLYLNDVKFYNGKLFIATESGLFWMHPSDEFVQEIRENSIRNQNILQLAVFNNKLVMTTQFGMYEYNDDSDKISFIDVQSTLPEFGFTAVNSLRDSMWVAGSQGVAVYDSKNDVWHSFNQLKYELSADFFDIDFTDGFVWFATNKGLLRYSLDMNSWYLYTQEDGLPSNKIYHIEVDEDTLWLSTERGMTLFRWSRPGRNE